MSYNIIIFYIIINYRIHQYW